MSQHQKQVFHLRLFKILFKGGMGKEGLIGLVTMPYP
jgi:hypothetical protein